MRQHASQALRVVAEGTAHLQLKCGSCKRRQHTGQLVHLATEQRLAFAFVEPDHADLVGLRVGDARQRLLNEVFRRRDHRPGHALVERALHAARERREGAAVDAGVYRQRGIENAVGFDRLVGLHAIAKEIMFVGHSGTHQRRGSCRKGRRSSDRVSRPERRILKNGVQFVGDLGFRVGIGAKQGSFSFCRLLGYEAIALQDIEPFDRVAAARGHSSNARARTRKLAATHTSKTIEPNTNIRSPHKLDEPSPRRAKKLSRAKFGTQLGSD